MILLWWILKSQKKIQDPLILQEFIHFELDGLQQMFDGEVFLE